MGYTSLTATQRRKRLLKDNIQFSTINRILDLFFFLRHVLNRTNQQAKGNILIDEISISDCNRKCTKLIAQLGKYHLLFR